MAVLMEHLQLVHTAPVVGQGVHQVTPPAQPVMGGEEDRIIVLVAEVVVVPASS